MQPLDADIAAAMQLMTGGAEAPPPPPVGDCLTRREQTDFAITFMATRVPVSVDADASDRVVPGPDGNDIPIRVYRSPGSGQRAVVLYLHGGGMIMGGIEVYDRMCRLYAASDVVVVSVDYRLAPEQPYPAGVEDCYTVLQWIVANAGELGAEPSRVAVAGDSGGGGLAAAVAQISRDRGGPELAAQILLYPMLDDRNTVPDPALVPTATWTYEDNETAWGAVLGDTAGGPETPPHAAPARADDLSGLAPAYIEVGNLDIFRDENIAYAARLAAAGVPVELHVHAGACHVFDLVAPASKVARRAFADRDRVLRGL